MTDLGNGLLAVSVPETDGEFYIAFSGWLCAKKSENDGIYEYIADQAQEKFEILGSVTASEIDFYVDTFVEGYVLDSYTTYTKAYTNYYNNKKGCWHADESFRSLLSSKGLFFKNPLGDVEPVMSMCSSKEECLQLRSEWQQAENNLVQKLIILKRL